MMKQVLSVIAAVIATASAAAAGPTQVISRDSHGRATEVQV